MVRRESLRKRGVWGERVVRESKTKKKLSPCGSVFRVHSAAAAPLTRVRCVHVRTKPRLGCRTAAISEEQCVRWPETGAVGGRAPAAGGAPSPAGEARALRAKNTPHARTHRRVRPLPSSPADVAGQGASLPPTRATRHFLGRAAFSARFFFFARGRALIQFLSRQQLTATPRPARPAGSQRRPSQTRASACPAEPA